MSSWWLPESPPGRTSVEGDGLEGFPREVGVSTQKGPCLVGAGEKSAGQRFPCFTTCPGCFLRQLCFHGLGANESWMKVLGIPLRLPMTCDCNPAPRTFPIYGLAASPRSALVGIPSNL